MRRVHDSMTWLTLFTLAQMTCVAATAQEPLPGAAQAAASAGERDPAGDVLIDEYFERQVSEIEAATFAGIKTLDDWQAQRTELRRQLAEMLGLDPPPSGPALHLSNADRPSTSDPASVAGQTALAAPAGSALNPPNADRPSTSDPASVAGQTALAARTPLKPVITRTLDHDEFTVEMLHFQSSPGLYVTGNLYVPKGLTSPAPAVLYVCGHARVKEEGVSLGNKTAYQHHGIWFARHGYVCLIVDTLQLGEIEGLHHGTYQEGMWWWQSRGYTPAGVEAWNGIRALDYLQTRPEVDATRLGVTGRSGGGATSWWIAALDERVKVAVPVAGICSLRNHLLGPFSTSPWSRGETHGHDGCIEGHCDCMYFINTYRWDFATVAALIAPRALLLSNTDKDRIFPLDGVYDVYTKTQRIYDLYDATEQLGLQICEGPHKDTQQLRVHAFQWFNRHLTGEEPLIDKPADKLFEPQTLKVLDELPADQLNTSIHDTFVPAATFEIPASPGAWTGARKALYDDLRAHVLTAWPDDAEELPLDVTERFRGESDGVQLTVYEFLSEAPYRLQMFVGQRSGTLLADAPSAAVHVLDDAAWQHFADSLTRRFPDAAALTHNSRQEQPAPATSSILPDLFTRVTAAAPVHVWLSVRGIGPTRWTENEKERTHILRRFALIGSTLSLAQAWDIHRGLQTLDTLPGGDRPRLSVTAQHELSGSLLIASLFGRPVEELHVDDPVIHLPAIPNLTRTLSPTGLVALAADRANVIIRTDLPDAWDDLTSAEDRFGWPADRVQVMTARE